MLKGDSMRTRSRNAVVMMLRQAADAAKWRLAQLESMTEAQQKRGSVNDGDKETLTALLQTQSESTDGDGIWEVAHA